MKSLVPSTAVATLVLVALASFEAAFAQGDELSQWYAGGSLGLVRVDSDQGASDDGALLRAILGRKLERNMAVELELATAEVEFPATGDLEQHHLSINALFINRDALWNPYVLVGAGAFRNDAPSFADTGPMAQLGVGGMWDLNGFGMMLRADLRYRYSSQDVSLVDDGQITATIGIDFPFR